MCAAHLPHGPRPVVQLHPNAKILIVGQARGAKVHASGVPFDDPSGVRLRDWLGLSKAQFYDPKTVALLPMGLCFPGRGSSGDLPPRPECAPTWRTQLLSCLPEVEFTIVLGQYAQAYHFPEVRGSLTDNVTAWRQFWPQRVPLPHPSPRNNRWLKRNPWFETEVLPALKGRIDDILKA